MAAKIKKGDMVMVLVGRDKGKTGLVLKVFPKESSAIVEKMNIAKRHQKARQGGGPSGIIEKAHPLSLSKLALIDQKSNKASRVRFETKDGKKVRVLVKSNTVVAA